MVPDNNDARANAHRPFLITFSGIDGAGKTTQIEILSSRLRQSGFRVLRLTFWDHVAVWSKMRTQVGYRTVSSPAADQLTENSFTPKNNKHVRKWYLSAARSAMYLLDVMRLRRLLASESVRTADVVIFDRYVYDQIVNIYSDSVTARIYARTLLHQTPAPDLAFILDTSADAAFARKPEYPLEFVRENRENFLRLRQLNSELITISGAAPDDVASEIYFHVCKSQLLEDIPHRAKTAVTAQDSLVLQQNSCSAQNGPTASI
jgi:thymidylate kinase